MSGELYHHLCPADVRSCGSTWEVKLVKWDKLGHARNGNDNGLRH